MKRSFYKLFEYWFSILDKYEMENIFNRLHLSWQLQVRLRLLISITFLSKPLKALKAHNTSNFKESKQMIKHFMSQRTSCNTFQRLWFPKMWPKTTLFRYLVNLKDITASFYLPSQKINLVYLVMRVLYRAVVLIISF